MVLRGPGAPGAAFGQFMLDLHTREHGYTEVPPPLLVRDAAMFGTGAVAEVRRGLVQGVKVVKAYCRAARGIPSRPSGAEGGWLIPTAEVSLTNLVRNSILGEEGIAVSVHRADAMFPRRGRRGGAGTRAA